MSILIEIEKTPAEFPCPQCRVRAGKSCRYPRGQSRTPHIARIHRAEEANQKIYKNLANMVKCGP